MKMNINAFSPAVTYHPVEIFYLQDMYILRTDDFSPVKTETSIRCDQENIYVTVKCYEPEEIHTGSTRNGYVVWEGDNVEVIFGNMGEHPWYRHFVLGAGGGRHSIYAGMDEWTGTVAALEPHYWQADFVIPFRLMGAYDSTLRFNLLRQRTYRNEWYTASKIVYGHDVECFLEIPLVYPADMIKHGPWVANVSTDRAMIGWETCGPCDPVLEIRRKGEAEYQLADNAVFPEDRKLHRVCLESLEPDTEYEYRTGNVNGGFRTMKQEDSDFSFLLLSDVHDDPIRFAEIIQYPEIRNCDFAVYLGDMLTSSLDRVLYYDAFLDASVKYWHKTFHYVRGNHELRGIGNGAYNDLFGSGHYTFSHGGILFILLEVEVDLAPEEKARWNAEQKAFLEELIRTPVFKNAKTRIVLSHVAPLMQGTDEGSAAENIFNVLPPGSIDLFISGHKHSYSYIASGSDKIDSVNKKRFAGRKAIVHDYPLLITHYGGFFRLDRKGPTLTVHVWDENNQKLDEKQIPLR